MKKLILSVFLSLFVFQIGVCQDPEIRPFDVSSAEKIADFSSKVGGHIFQDEIRYVIKHTYNQNSFYVRKKEPGSIWELVTFPNSVSLEAKPIYINGEWLVAKFHNEVQEFGSDVRYISWLQFYRLDFDSVTVQLKSEIQKVTPIRPVASSCSPYSFSYKKINSNLYVTAHAPCDPTEYFTSRDAGSTWNSGGISIDQKTIFETEIGAITIDTSKMYTNGSGGIVLPKIISPTGVSNIIFYQDTLNIFLYNHEVMRTPDWGATWTIEQLPFEPYGLIDFDKNDQYFFCANRFGIFRSQDIMMSDYKDITPDTLDDDRTVYKMTTGDSNDLLISKGDYYRSTDNGSTWKKYNEGFPRVGLQDLEIFNGKLWGQDGNLASSEGEMWERGHSLKRNSTNFFSDENSGYLLMKDEKQTFLYEKDNSGQWVVSKIFDSENRVDAEMFFDKSTESILIEYLDSDTLYQRKRGEFEWKKFVFRDKIRDTWLPSNNFGIRGQSVFVVKNDAYWITNDFGETWDSVFHVNDYHEKFISFDSVLLRYNDWKGIIDISKDWGYSWQPVVSKFGPGIWGEYLKMKKKGDLLVEQNHSKLNISPDLGKSWIQIPGEYLDFAFLDSTLYLSKRDGIYKIEAQEILEFFDERTRVSSLSDNFHFEKNIQISPNPFTDQILIKTDNSIFSITELQLLNQLGQPILKKKISENAFELNTENLPKGIYFLSLKFKTGGTTTQKVVKH